MSRYVPEKLGGIDQAAAAVESETHQFVRRGARSRQRLRSEKDAAASEPGDNLNLLIQRVTAASTEEIDRIVLELYDVRDVLRSQGEHVCQNISSYASLNHTAMTAMKVIGENLKQWKQIR